MMSGTAASSATMRSEPVRHNGRLPSISLMAELARARNSVGMLVIFRFVSNQNENLDLTVPTSALREDSKCFSKPFEPKVIYQQIESLHLFV